MSFRSLSNKDHQCRTCHFTTDQYPAQCYFSVVPVHSKFEKSSPRPGPVHASFPRSSPRPGPVHARFSKSSPRLVHCIKSPVQSMVHGLVHGLVHAGPWTQGVLLYKEESNTNHYHETVSVAWSRLTAAAGYCIHRNKHLTDLSILIRAKLVIKINL